MNIPNFYEEVIVFGLLLLAVFGVYMMLKVHYHFAFGLMKNTSSYEKNKTIIDKTKKYQRTGCMTCKNGQKNKVNAVCWHGYRDFMIKLYKISDNLTNRSSIR